MKPKSLYPLLCVLGTVLPYSQLVPFLPLFLYLRELRLERSTLGSPSPED